MRSRHPLVPSSSSSRDEKLGWQDDPQRTKPSLIYIYIYIMLFLRSEVHRFCMNILFYNFYMNFIEILWYWEFMMMQSNLCSTSCIMPQTWLSWIIHFIIWLTLRFMGWLLFTLKIAHVTIRFQSKALFLQLLHIHFKYVCITDNINSFKVSCLVTSMAWKFLMVLLFTPCKSNWKRIEVSLTNLKRPCFFCYCITNKQWSKVVTLNNQNTWTNGNGSSFKINW
jgi:hypothetical protein